ncbi:hypothetical protein N9741_03835 [Octadecabacter sp.]|nr:hypothetical protein [Octadecabacter sp.]
MKQPTKRSVNFNAASPSWQTDVSLDDLTKLTPSFPEQDGDIVFGSDGRPTGIYVADATPKRTWQDMPVADDMSFGQDDPIVVPAPTRQTTTLDQDELEFDGPNPFGERALDIYGQSVGQIESGNRYEITGGYNNHYQGRYQMGRDALADVGVGYTAADREAFLADPDAQDAAFRAFTLQNHATLSRLSRRYREMPRTEQLGILGYAHNQGAGGAIDYLRTGTAGRDGFGTNPEIYINAIRNGLAAGQTQEGDTDAS